MSVANKIFTNTLWQVVIRAINILLGVFSLALITRLLGPVGFGFYTTIFAFVQVFMIVADLGLYLSLLREISAPKDSFSENRKVNNIFTIRLLASLLILIIIPVAVQFFPYDDQVKSGVFYFMWAFFFQSLISTLTAVFSRHLDMAKVAVVDLLNKVLYVIFLVYLFNSSGQSLNQVLSVASLAYLIAFGLFYLFLTKYVKLRLAWDLAYWKKIFHTTWPLAVTVILNLLYFKADTLVLSAYHSPEEVGLYGAPYRVLEAITTFPHMFMSLILPLFTAAWLGKQIGRLNQVLQYNFDFFSIITLGMITITWLISRPLMVLLAGPDFILSGGILNILIIATAGIFFGTLFTYLIVALGLQKKMIKYFLITALVGLIGYFVFIPPFSYWGAAYMTLLVELLIIFFAWLVIRKEITLQIKLKVFAKSCLAALIAMTVVWPFKDINLVLTIVSAGLIYLFVLFLSRAVNRGLIREIFKRT